MERKFATYSVLRMMIWSLLAVLLVTLLPGISTNDSSLSLKNKVVFAQAPGPAPGAETPTPEPDDDDDDNTPGQGYCPDGETSVPGGVDKIKFCRDNSHFPPKFDFIEDRWCGFIARFRMFVPFGHRYNVICLEEGPPFPFGIRKVDYRIVTLLRNDDDQEIKEHAPPLLWKLLNRRDFAGSNDTVVLLRWNEDVEPAQWEFVPGSENEDGTVDYLVNHTSLFAVGLSDNPAIEQSFVAPETVIPAGLPRTGMAANNAIPWGLGSLMMAGLAIIAGVGLWRWRGQ